MANQVLKSRVMLAITPINQHTYGWSACWYAAALMVLDGVRTRLDHDAPIKNYHPLENAWVKKKAKEKILLDQHIVRFMAAFGFESKYFSLSGQELEKALLTHGPLMYPSGKGGVRHFYVIGGIATFEDGTVKLDVLDPSDASRVNGIEITDFLVRYKPSHQQAGPKFLAMYMSNHQKVPDGLDPKREQKMKALEQMFG